MTSGEAGAEAPQYGGFDPEPYAQGRRQRAMSVSPGTRPASPPGEPALVQLPEPLSIDIATDDFPVYGGAPRP